MIIGNIYCTEYLLKYKMLNQYLYFKLFRLPQSLRKSSAEMIIAMLQSAPEKRPSVYELFLYDFLTKNYVPKSLPASCLEMAPRNDQLEGGEHEAGVNRKPLIEINDNLGNYIQKIYKLICETD